MENYIGILICICISFYLSSLSSIESLEDRDLTALGFVSWALYIIFAKGGLEWHSPQ